MGWWSVVCWWFCNTPEVDCRLTEKDKLIKTQNILTEQTNQLISHIETFTANLQNLENTIKPIKTHGNVSRDMKNVQICYRIRAR